MENRQVSVRIRLRKPEEKTLLVSANGNAAETRWKHLKTFQLTETLRKHRTFSPFFSYMFPVVTNLRKRNGNVNCQVSVNFPNYGNALFHPVRHKIKHRKMGQKHLIRTATHSWRVNTQIKKQSEQ